MSFTDRLEYLMRKNGIRNKSELSKQSGIPEEQEEVDNFVEYVKSKRS